MDIPQLGPWEVDRDRRLGRGGFSEVFACTAPGNREVEHAIKIYRKHSHPNTFLREVDNLQRVTTSRFCPSLIDYGKDDQGALCIVTEQVQGNSLRRQIRSDGPIGLEQTTRLITCVLEALKVAHGGGISHLDVQSPNIRVSGRDYFLLDWGAGRPLGGGRLAGFQTNRTIAAPELYFGEFSEATDFYCLGWLAVYALTGDLPFHRHVLNSKSYSSYAHCFERPILHGQIIDPLRALILSWIQKRPEDRLVGYELPLLLQEASKMPLPEPQGSSFHDFCRVTDFIEAGARAGVPTLQYQFARSLLETGQDREAAQWFARAGDAGEGRGYRQLALLLEEGPGVVIPSQSCRLLRKALDCGDTFSGYLLAKRIVSGVCPGDFGEAEQLALAAAEAGDARAQYFLATRIYADEERSLKSDYYLSLAAERGHARAREMLSKRRGRD